MRYQKKKITAIIMLFILTFTLVDVPMFPVQAADVIDITDSELLEIIGVEDVTYSGREIVQNITVKYDGNTMVENTDYYCLYTNNTNAGTATIRIVGKGNYTGQKKFLSRLRRQFLTILLIVPLQELMVTRLVILNYRSVTMVYLHGMKN